MRTLDRTFPCESCNWSYGRWSLVLCQRLRLTTIVLEIQFDKNSEHVHCTNNVRINEQSFCMNNSTGMSTI